MVFDFKSIENRVYEYPTKNKMGFTSQEIDEFLKEYPQCNMDFFNQSLIGVTGSISDTGEFVFYHSDVYSALKMGLLNKRLSNSDWD